MSTQDTPTLRMNQGRVGISPHCIALGRRDALPYLQPDYVFLQ